MAWNKMAWCRALTRAAREVARSRWQWIGCPDGKAPEPHHFLAIGSVFEEVEADFENCRQWFHRNEWRQCIKIFKIFGGSINCLD
jgi:hypothetical protein